MKVEVFEPEEDHKPERTYPYYGKHNGGIVLFYKPEAGIRIKKRPDYDGDAIGDHHDYRSEDYFTPLPEGTIIVIAI